LKVNIQPTLPHYDLPLAHQSRRRRVLTLCSLVHGFNHSYWVILPPLLPIIISEFEISTLKAGLLASAFFLPYAAFQLPVGYIADRADRRLLIGLGLLLSATGTTLTGFAPNYGALLLLQALAGLGGATYHPAALALIAHFFPSEERGRATGFHGISTNLSFFITPVAVIYMAAWGWRTPFLIFGLLGAAVSAVFLLLIGRQAGSTITERREGMRALLRSSSFLRLAGISSSIAVVDRGIVTFLPLFFTVVYGFGVISAGQALALFFLSGLAGQLLGGYLTDRIDRKLLLAILLTVIGSATVALALAPSPLLALLMLATLAVAIFSSFPLTETVATTLFPATSRASGLGVYFTICIGIGAVSPYVIGDAIASLGYQPAYIILALVAFAGIPLTLRTKIPNR